MFLRTLSLPRLAVATLALMLARLPAGAAELSAPAADVPPPWAYPFDPPGLVPTVDDGSLRHVPESTQAYTLSQVRDGFHAPDWHPEAHPAMPEIVVNGRKPEVMACGYCHRAEGTGGPENTSLAGLPAAYIIQQMADFKSGARASAIPLRAPPKNMVAAAKGATTAEVEAAAAYFSALKPKANIRVVETEMVPKTQVRGWHLSDLKSGEQEPIGQRIIEVPEDLEQFISRDTRAKFIAYVPVGSIEKGKVLAATGGNGRTVQCVVCHGPDLKGLGPIPGIAGRTPSYLVRQLYDFQHGTRAGLSSALMKPTVEKLTIDDMIVLAAYAASLTP